MKREYRVVTEDIRVWAESVDEAIDMARNDTGGRVYAEATGLTVCEDGDPAECCDCAADATCMECSGCDEHCTCEKEPPHQDGCVCADCSDCDMTQWAKNH